MLTFNLTGLPYNDRLSLLREARANKKRLTNTITVLSGVIERRKHSEHLDTLKVKDPRLSTDDLKRYAWYLENVTVEDISLLRFLGVIYDRSPIKRYSERKTSIEHRPFKKELVWEAESTFKKRIGQYTENSCYPFAVEIIREGDGFKWGNLDGYGLQIDESIYGTSDQLTLLNDRVNTRLEVTDAYIKHLLKSTHSSKKPKEIDPKIMENFLELRRHLRLRFFKGNTPLTLGDIKRYSSFIRISSPYTLTVLKRLGVVILPSKNKVDVLSIKDGIARYSNETQDLDESCGWQYRYRSYFELVDVKGNIYWKELANPPELAIT